VPSPVSKVVTFGTAYGSLATTTRSGYTFGGWWTAPNGGGTQVTAATGVSAVVDHTLYAKWTANAYTVTFNAQSGTVPIPGNKDVPYASVYGTLAATARAGYTFSGWWTAPIGGGTEVTDATVLTTAADHTLYAKWTALPEYLMVAESKVAVGTTAVGTLRASGQNTTVSFTVTGGSDQAKFTLDQSTGALQLLAAAAPADLGNKYYVVVTAEDTTANTAKIVIEVTVVPSGTARTGTIYIFK